MSSTDFGNLLKRLRETNGVSQSKLAERASFDHSYVSRLESGARMPTREAVDRLGTAMSLDPAELDSLLASAGFLPKDVSSLLSAEPAL
ncbi:MAG TPA: helix-turn-helix transcriptional regulator [Thermomicrobiales bacterium]|nr:helix-turn-helix transcriptional regulator [Thermomicrobiales bacterium]